MTEEHPRNSLEATGMDRAVAASRCRAWGSCPDERQFWYPQHSINGPRCRSGNGEQEEEDPNLDTKES